MNEIYHVRIGRVILRSEAIDARQARRLHAAINEVLSSELAQGPPPEAAVADTIRIDMPPFALTSPEGERRAAHDAAAAIVRALRGAFR